jgi:nucleoid-associated protein YgaU
MTYTVRSGDTLSTIAQSFYNNPDMWSLIYDVNIHIIGRNPDRIEPGMKLHIPEIILPDIPH